MEFESIRLIIILVSTIACMFFTFKNRNLKQKFFLLFTFVFLILYSGLGGALKEAHPDYTWYYVVYIFILALVINKSKFYINYSKDENSLNAFLLKYAKSFIFTYFIIKFFGFIIPEVKIGNLISPPVPSLQEFDFTQEGNNYGGGAIASLLYFLSSLITPFFYWGLYIYKNKPRLIILLLFINLYMTYCNTGYVGRGTILEFGLISFFTYYFYVNKEQRKKLLIYIGCAAPFILFGFYYYSLVRLGNDLQGETITDAIQVLFGQEIGYPLHFKYYITSHVNYIGDYLEWLVLLPFPGFVKLGYGNFFLNQVFSMYILGVDVSDSTFFVVLPGVIGESIFVFGPSLFFIHAILLGITINFVLRTFTSSNSFTYIFYLFIIQFSFMLGRAGTISVYPMMLKSFIILVIVCNYIRKKYRSNNMK